MKIGYIRNPKGEQNISKTSKLIALQQAGCRTIFSDLLDFVGDEQPNLALALEYARAGDTLIIWDISALSSDTSYVLDVMHTLQKKDISLQIISGTFSDIKPCSWESRVMLEVCSVLANLEHRLKSKY